MFYYEEDVGRESRKIHIFKIKRLDIFEQEGIWEINFGPGAW